MRKGQLVRVKMYPNKELERVVLEEHNTYVLVCRPEIYDAIRESDGLPASVMGFPKEDVIEVSQ